MKNLLEKAFQNSHHISHKNRGMNSVQGRRYIRDIFVDVISKFSLALAC
jgi:hypothetical protein